MKDPRKNNGSVREMPDRHDLQRRSVESLIPKRRPYPKRKNRQGMLWVFLFLLFLAYLVGYVINFATKPQISETRVVMGSVDAPKVFNGVIVRDEEVYVSKATGTVIFEVADRERVKNGSAVCSVQNSTDVSENEKNLENVNKSIMTMQATRSSYSLYDAEIKASNAHIKKTLDEGSFDFSTLSVENLYSLKSRVEQNLDTRNQMLLNENRGSLRSLLQQRSIYEERLSSAIQNVYSSESGIVSYGTDGMEKILTVENLGIVSRDQTEAKIPANNYTFKKEVAVGDTLFKLIKSNSWYVAAYLPEKTAEKWVENGAKTIYIKQDGEFTPLETNVYKMQKAGSEYYVVFKTSRKTLEFVDIRSIEFRVNDGVMEGLKISNTAIVEKTLLKIPNKCVYISKNKPQVIKRTDAEDKVTDISVVKTDNNFSYVLQNYSTLKYGDTLMVSGTDGQTAEISEIENCFGVFVTNQGAANFVLISKDGLFSSNSEYTILDPNFNKTLKVHDKIVGDAELIENRQVVK